MNEDNTFNELKEFVKIINESNKREIIELEDLVDEIIEYENEDEKTISYLFDRMLSMEFVAEDDLKEIYYKLLRYSEKIDKELSKDYEQFFIEKFDNIDDEQDNLES